MATIWEIGDYGKISSQLVFAAELLAEEMLPTASWRLLDVGTGTGNGALSFARRRLEVVGIDPALELLKRARNRAEVEGVDVQFLEGVAEKLPFEDKSFDASVAIFAIEFAADFEKAVSEMARVIKPRGKIGLVDWKYAGTTPEFEENIMRFMNTPIERPRNYTFGDEKHVKEFLSPYFDEIHCSTKEVLFRFRHANDWIDTYKTYFGPINALFASLSKEKAAGLEELIIRFLNKTNRAHDGSLLIPFNYLQTTAVRRS